MTDTPVRKRLGIVVCEDDPRYRAGLEALIEAEDALALAASFDSPTPLLRAVDSRNTAGWDLAIMDVELPGMNGIEATRRLKAALPAVPVVMLTVFEEPRLIVEAICAGADGYMLKRTPAAELVDGLLAIASGGSPLTPGVARVVLDLVRTTAPPRVDPIELSEQELRVLRCMARGLVYKQVADELSISINTVRTYVRRVYKKLQTHTASEAVTKALRAGLI
jgi:DNA-binding NarL/FixJ family response regulator